MTGALLTTTFSQHSTLTITPPRSRNNSTASSDTPPSPCHLVSLGELTSPELKVVIDCDTKLILRPNHVYRGKI